MTEELSVLARQRAEDAALCERLRTIWPNHVEPTAAADRIEQLGQDLAEACHARDRLERELAEARGGVVYAPPHRIKAEER